MAAAAAVVALLALLVVLGYVDRLGPLVSGHHEPVAPPPAAGWAGPDKAPAARAGANAHSGSVGTRSSGPGVGASTPPPATDSGRTRRCSDREAGQPARTLDNACGRWAAVLADIDRRRESAWHRGDPAGLAKVFVPGSAELGADRRLLSAYVSRGLHVDGVSMHYRVLRVESMTAGRTRLLVRDRLGDAVAGDGDGHRNRLPRDRPSRQYVTVVWASGSWLISAVSPAV